MSCRTSLFVVFLLVQHASLALGHSLFPMVRGVSLCHLHVVCGVSRLVRHASDRGFLQLLAHGFLGAFGVCSRHFSWGQRDSLAGCFADA